MKQLAAAAILAGAVAGTAYAQEPSSTTTTPPRTITTTPDTSTTTGLAAPIQSEVLSTIPSSATTVTNFYKQNVYDRSDAKVGEITDVLVSKEGRIDGFIMSVGGFLGIGEKNVAVPFNAVQGTQRNGSWWLSMDATKAQLEKAPGFKYDRAKATWIPA